MASLRIDPRTKHWCVRFYYNDVRYQHSCRTPRKQKALRILGTIEEMLEDLHNGRRSIPENTDPRDWIVSGGKLELSPAMTSRANTTFGELCDHYFADQRRKAESTLKAETTHINHLKRILRSSTRPASINLDHLKRYVKRRESETYRGKPIGQAIRRELATFRQIWVWAQDNEYVQLACPLLRTTGRWRIQLPKPKERQKFQTWQQIERQIARGGLNDDEIKELWDSVFLDEQQVVELLDYVQETAVHPFIYPMFIFLAYTGACRSELMRSRIDDADFESGQLMIRERKRRKELSGSYRFVPLHPRLRAVLEEWFAVHPGGNQMFAVPTKIPRRSPINSPLPLTRNQATHHFKMTLRGSKWSVVRGFHVLRHSFGSNLVRTGKVPSTAVARWMGHTTAEMQGLYQHLFPQDGVEQISVLM